MKWKKYKIDDVIERQFDGLQLDELKSYKRLTVRTKGKGVSLRDKEIGFNIGTKKQYLVKHNQFLLSKIDAMNGAFGIVPQECHGGIITGNFWTYKINEKIASIEFLRLLAEGQIFTSFSIKASSGSTNRKYLDENEFLKLDINLPDLPEQQRIVNKIQIVRSKLEQLIKLKNKQEKELKNLLYSKFIDLTIGAEYDKIENIAPIVRRPVEVDHLKEYPELGIRSFGKGTFHKPSLKGIEVGTKKLYTIKEGDLLFSNVFAWEGAIAVVQSEDNDRVGSHRFISCRCNKGKILQEYLCYYFLSEEGMEKIRLASPGGAGRNKTLGLKKLERIKVPTPKIEKQIEFIKFKQKIEQTFEEKKTNREQIKKLMPNLLSKAFKGEL